MWHGDTVYYLSDNGEEEKLNIWAYDVRRNEREQITRFTEYDVKWPSIGPGERGQGEIVFQNGSELYLLNLRNKASKPVKVIIPGDRPTIRTRRIDVSNRLGGGGISATGKRATVEARGDIWTVPAENGAPRNLTRTSGVAERSPAWSPDGRWIAYFSDETGDYELYITQSDGKGETKQLTEGSKTFYMDAFWSPDSKKIALLEKDARILLHDIESGETKEIDQDPRAQYMDLKWSHDSRWITYARSLEEIMGTAICVYDVENGELHQVTSGMFPDFSPTFDRKGDYLYFASNRRFSPSYEDYGATWIYDEGGVLIAVPLRSDVEAPWQLESDEEEWEEEEAKDEDGEVGEEGAEGDEDDGDAEAENGEGEKAEDGNGDDEEEAPKHPLHGVWEGSVSGLKAMLEPMIPPDAGIEISDTAPYSMNIFVDEEGNISGTSTIEIMGQSQTEDLGEVTFNEETGEYVEIDEEEGNRSVMRGTLENGTISGTWEVTGMMTGSGTWSVTRTEEEAEEPEEAAEVVEIELEGFEQRAIMLPVGVGNYANLAVNDKNQLLYVKRGDGIKLFDISDDKKAEQNVASGAMGFDISADGKKIIYRDSGGFKIGKAGAGAAGKPISTAGMIAYVNPREEWKQVFTDAWRIQRDFFYAANMHGVNWQAVYEQYLKMLEFCNTREDVSYVIGEMIGELNVGHSYYFGGDTDFASQVGSGTLGVDFALENGAYRITKIHTGAPWDVDARGPIMGSGADIKEGDYLLAVNGLPMDTSRDPWAAFIGLAGRTTTLTVSEKPEMDDDAREVLIKPANSDGVLRFRAWIEANRKYVEEMTDGKVGYIYVRDTSIPGQSDLVRQFVGQHGKEALIIDERWNGGGQLPDRFIELLNRPLSSYFAIREGKEWKVPMVSHQGPKCMLINGNAGSGGDMFPWLFRDAGLGPLIGTRTWGGLVGMIGNPPLIDGGYTSVPRIAFFEPDGTWAVEGHGVDPDIEVIADPSLMVDGGDPQLDKAIEVMLAELEKNPFVPTKRPEWPDRSGIGIEESDK
jgi:C-terminal processing protease CtpA/Prc/WD40 repeat protein